MYKFLNLFILFLSLFSSSLYAQRTGKTTIAGNECEYDTLLYRHIGPGATYLQTQFNAIPVGTKTQKMRCHVIAIDLTNPYNKFNAYMAQDKYYKTSKQPVEVANRKAAGLKPVASLNSCGFSMYGSQTTNINELSGNMIIDNEVRYGVSKKGLNWFINEDGTSNVAYTTFQGSATSSAGSTMAISQVNHFRDNAGSGKLALFCNLIPKTRAKDSSTGVDVILTHAEGSSMLVGENKMVVKEVLAGCEHTLANGEAALSGVGSAAEAYLNALQVGEEVTINLDYKDLQGNSIIPTDMTTAFMENCVLDGVVQNISKSQLAVSCVGVSKDGKTLYMSNLESNANSGTSFAYFAEFLVNQGMWNGMWLDTSISAEMTVDGALVTTTGLAGRYIPAGFMFYSTAPDDATLTYVESPHATRLQMSVGDTQALSFYGYNQYGEMIDGNVASNDDVEITSNLGTFADGIFTATQTGIGTLNVKLKDGTTLLAMPVNTFGHIHPDVNGDGRINQDDLHMVLKNITGEDTANASQADVDGDGDVDIRDAAIIIEHIRQ